MTEAEAVAALDAIQGAHDGKSGRGDPEKAHQQADAVLLTFVPPTVRDAYERCADRQWGWWYA